MRIRRLKLSGFKSFVEPVDLRIEAGLTGVVGPNGCGKSNLLEAIRWVMGEGSAKSLRGGGMEDVIFAGTATRPARDFAEVTLSLETADGDSDVTRRIERGAGSAYRVDGRDVRAKDVSLLFADAATGAHSPALVSQGRIGAVIAARPTERRQMLEEAAGISGLHARRKDAEQKLRAAEANIARLDELIGDQDARAAALRRQARAAERYRDLSDRIRIAEGRLLHARWAEADRAAEAAHADARAAGQQVASLQDARERAQAAQAQAASELARRRDALVALRSEGQALAHRLATVRAQRDTIVRRIDELARMAASLGAERAREQALSEDAAAAIATLDSERTAIDARLADAETQAARIAGELGACELTSREAEAALAEILAQEAAMRAERRVAAAALDSARAQAARAQAEAKRLSEQRAALDDDGSWTDALAAARAAGEAAVQSASVNEADLVAAEAGRAAAAEARDQAESALAASRAVQAAAQSEHDALTRALAQAEGGGAIAGLSADPGYERALAAALGDDLDAAIGGDAPRRWTGSPATPDDPALADGLTALIRHVRAPEALQRRLAQIALVETDDGQRLAVGQRLVTRDGQLRRWDGFVSIGAGAAAAERLIRLNRLAALSEELPAMRAATEEAQANRQRTEEDVATLRKAADTARQAVTAAERRGREAARAEQEAANAIDRLSAQRASLTERLDDLAPVLTASAAAVAGAEATLAGLADPQFLADAIVTARGVATAAGESVADKRAEAATRARETAADRERHAAAGREQGEWRARSRRAEERLVETAARVAAQEEERQALASQPDGLAAEIADLEQESGASGPAIAAAAGAEADAQSAVDGVAGALAQTAEAFAMAREARAGALARAEGQEARRAELSRQSGERFECPPPLLPDRVGFEPDPGIDPETERASLDRLTVDRERLGPVNLVAESELAELEADRARGTVERDELAQAIARLRGSIGSLNREGRVRLLDAYAKVDGHFRRLFATLFDGGQAHLELVESDDPLEAGLEIMAQPPGKRLSALTLLSGGEQALTAVALIFALFLTNPAPICVLDEVDAPLDDANVERFCDLLARMSAETDTRYLIVTHNAVTMSRMHRLYGVTMIEKGVSRLVSVDLGGASQLLAAQ